MIPRGPCCRCEEQWRRPARAEDHLPGGDWTVEGVSILFTSQYRDTELANSALPSGLDYFMARHRASGLGRFLQPDPGNAGAVAGFPQSWHGYGYVANNPMIYVNPSGLDPVDVGGGCTWDAETNTLNCTAPPRGGEGVGEEEDLIVSFSDSSVGDFLVLSASRIHQRHQHRPYCC